jgi:adenylate kinase family enzyme
MRAVDAVTPGARALIAPAARLLVFGNSGAGKSTLAQRLAGRHGLAHLDLDTLAWLPGEPPRRRPLPAAHADIAAFTSAHQARGWVVEGCYADLLAPAAAWCTLMLFLNPGVEACVAHCLARPWEPHKYPDPAAQQRNLPMLLDWVRGYGSRADEFSLASHRALFDGFGGEKLELDADAAAALG